MVDVSTGFLNAIRGPDLVGAQAQGVNNAIRQILAANQLQNTQLAQQQVQQQAAAAAAAAQSAAAQRAILGQGAQDDGTFDFDGTSTLLAQRGFLDSAVKLGKIKEQATVEQLTPADELALLTDAVDFLNTGGARAAAENPQIRERIEDGIGKLVGTPDFRFSQRQLDRVASEDSDFKLVEQADGSLQLVDLNQQQAGDKVGVAGGPDTVINVNDEAAKIKAKKRAEAEVEDELSQERAVPVLNQYLTAVEQLAAEPTADNLARVQQLQNSAAQALARKRNPERVTDDDVRIAREALPSPLGITNLATGGATLSTQIEAFREAEGIEAAIEPQPAADGPVAVNPDTGETMQLIDGEWVVIDG